MASRKRNNKTRPQMDEGTDTFVAPDSQQALNAPRGEDTEIVDLNAGTTEVDLNAGKGGGGEASETGDGNDAGTGGTRETTEGDVGATGRNGSEPNRRSPSSRERGRRASQGDDDGDDQDDAGTGGYGQRVRARIRRERAVVNRERALREQTEARLAEERTARQALEQRLAKVERAQTDVSANTDVKALEAQIAALLPQIAAATEAGETAKALELQAKLGDLQADLKLLKYDLAQRQRAAEAEDRRRQQQQQQHGQQTDPRAGNPVAKRMSDEFIRQNRHWWNRSRHKQAKDDAVQIDLEILNEIDSGDVDFEPYSDEHFEELATRLHETYPELEVCDLNGDAYNFDDDEEDEDMYDEDRYERGRNRDRRGTRRDNDRGDRRAPVGRGPSNAGVRVNGRQRHSEADLARQGKVRLEQNDFATMRTFGMDPNNPEHKKYFAKERQRSILTDERRNGGGR